MAHGLTNQSVNQTNRLNQWKEHWESLRVVSTLYLGTLQIGIFFFSEWSASRLSAESQVGRDSK
jgi:hypothetical protein